MPLPALKPLAREDRPLFERAFSAAIVPLASYSFAYHYLWQDHFQFEWTRTESHLFLFARYDGHFYMPVPPLGPLDPRAIESGWEKMAKENRRPAASRIENVPEAWEETYRQLGFRVIPKDPEYLYARADLARLPGDRYKSPRWACNRFERESRPTLHPYSSEDEEKCLELFERWEKNRMEKNRGEEYRIMLEDSRSVHRRALAEGDRIGLVGKVLKADGKIAGYTFGYPLPGDTFCVLLEATDLSRTGAAAYLFRAFCRELSSYTLINTLDDSGLENLRRAKEAYHPVRKIRSLLATAS
jgi:hypothetical protein